MREKLKRRKLSGKVIQKMEEARKAADACCTGEERERECGYATITMETKAHQRE